MTSLPSAILVTGGAGYIGSHTVRRLAEAGERIVVLDSLAQGHREALISPGVELVVGEIGDPEVLRRIFRTWSIEAVLHFAAWALVGESVREPLKYYRNNTAAPIELLDAMRAHGTRQFILSSTCATYGNPEYLPMDERHPQNPVNPYGHSKRMLEQILHDCDTAYGIRHVILRYFNACGSSPDGAIGEDHDPETHIIPRALMAVTGEIGKLTVFGDDYPTPDGTCIRDYVHVLDLADAHVRALEHLRGGGESLACNLGTGTGISVRRILDLVAEVTGKPVPVEFGARREGDPPELVANPAFAAQALGWTARYTDPREMVETAWRWLTGPRKGRYASQPVS